MSLAQVTKQKSYLNRPKALGITVRRLQFHLKKLNDITLPIHLSCHICSLPCLRPFRLVNNFLYIACVMFG
jgi:hypothetical protein